MFNTKRMLRFITVRLIFLLSVQLLAEHCLGQNQSIVPQPVSSFGKTVNKSWNQLTSRKSDVTRAREFEWHWRPAVPNGVPRGETLAVVLPEPEALALFPDLDKGVQQASASSAPSKYWITQIGGATVRSRADFQAALQDSLDSGKPCPCEIALHNGTGIEKKWSMDTSTQDLAVIDAAVFAKAPSASVTIDGMPWLLHCQRGMRYRVALQVERRTGLVQVIIGMLATGEQPINAPSEIWMTCDRQPLRCLNVSNTLEVLYGDREKVLGPPARAETSFANVSERSDYRMPTNFDRLQHLFEERFEPSLSDSIQPSLAVVPGEAYPGPPILGDARALSEFIVQKQLIQPGEKESTGWVMFAGSSVHKGHNFMLHIQIAGEDQPCNFLLAE